MKRVPVHESPERLLPEISEEHENDLNDGAMVDVNVQQHDVNEDDAIEQNQGEEHVVIGVQHDENDDGHTNIQHDENDDNHAILQHNENDDGNANVQHDQNDVNHANVRHEGNDDEGHLNSAQQQREGIDEGSFSNFLICHFD